MMVIYLPVKFEFDWTNHSEMKKVDGQMDVGHINLIGGLGTRNPPKNVGDKVHSQHQLIETTDLGLTPKFCKSQHFQAI